MGKVIAVWSFFNGKKTAIGAILFASHDLLMAMAALYPICADIAGPVKEAAYIFTGGGLGHKTMKSLQ